MLDELRNGSFVHFLNFKSDRLQTPAVSVGGLCERAAKVKDCTVNRWLFLLHFGCVSETIKPFVLFPHQAKPLSLFDCQHQLPPPHTYWV